MNLIEGGCPLRSLQDEIESFNDVGVKSIHRFQNTLPFKGLSLIESYIEGVLWIALEYRSAAANEVGVSGFLVLLNGQGHARKAVTCFLPEFVEQFSRFPNDHICGCRDKDVMLVSNVQKVQPIEAKLPIFVRLYLIENDIDNCIGRSQSLEFLSIDGTFKRFPVLAERKEGMFSNRSLVFLDHDAISVVEGGLEVVQRIAQNGRGVFGEEPRRGALPLQKSVIALEAQSLYIVRDKLFENSFEAVDVMFGPFYL